MSKVNPNITSIIRQPISVRQHFNRVLNETIRKRKPLIRNLYTDSKNTRKNKTKYDIGYSLLI